MSWRTLGSQSSSRPVSPALTRSSPKFAGVEHVRWGAKSFPQADWYLNRFLMGCWQRQLESRQEPLLNEGSFQVGCERKKRMSVRDGLVLFDCYRKSVRQVCRCETELDKSPVSERRMCRLCERAISVDCQRRPSVLTDTFKSAVGGSRWVTTPVNVRDVCRSARDPFQTLVGERPLCQSARELHCW